MKYHFIFNSLFFTLLIIKITASVSYSTEKQIIPKVENTKENIIDAIDPYKDMLLILNDSGKEIKKYP